MLFWAMVNKIFEPNVKKSNRNGTDKINSISVDLTKIKVSFDFSGSLTSLTGNLGCACAYL